MSNEDQEIRNKIALLRLADQLGNVSQACQMMGYSRGSYYRLKRLYALHGEAGLRKISRRQPLPKNRVPPEVEQAVVNVAVDYPAFGQQQVSIELKKQGITISPGGVRSIWQRHQLETFTKRVQALEKRLVDDEAMVLTESQRLALQKAEAQRQAEREIETAYPGFLGTQDTLYLGTIRDVGRIYQQTFIDTYSNVAFARLYDRRSAWTAVDLLAEQVIPFFNQHQVPLLRILTDRGTEYCGPIHDHDYQLYLVHEHIDHTQTKARSPQFNIICRQFHRTIQQEFYQPAFHTKHNTSLDQLQADLEAWLDFFNRERPFSGKYCDGRTPLLTFRQTKRLSQ